MSELSLFTTVYYLRSFAAKSSRRTLASTSKLSRTWQLLGTKYVASCGVSQFNESRITCQLASRFKEQLLIAEARATARGRAAVLPEPAPASRPEGPGAEAAPASVLEDADVIPNELRAEPPEGVKVAAAEGEEEEPHTEDPNVD